VIFLGNLFEIEEGAFENCHALSAVALPNSLRSIDPAAFTATGLTTLVLPEGLTTISRSAFSRCQSLTTVTSPKSAELVDDGAFGACTSLNSAVMKNAFIVVGVENDQGLGPEGPTHVHENAFGDDAVKTHCKKLRQLGNDAEDFSVRQKPVALIYVLTF